MSVSRFLSLTCALGLSTSFLSATVQAAESTRVLSRESVTAQYADTQSRFIDVDGVKVHYKDQGSGPAILLVHGTMGDLGDWDAWANVLSQSYRVLRIDLPSFGLSGPIQNGNYSIDRLLSLVDGFTDLVGAEHFAIAGMSYGGLVAFRYAATRTDRVTALILANSAGIEFGKSAEDAEKVKPQAKGRTVPKGSLFFGEVITADDIEGNLHHMLADSSLVTPERIARKLAFANIQGRGDEARAGVKLYERADPMRTLARVRAPALILWGGANRALSTQTADAFAASLKNACQVERKIYPNGGHMLVVDTADQTSRDTKNFLDKLPSATACRASVTAAK